MIASLRWRRAMAVWRDARDCVLAAHADFQASPPQEWDRRLVCLIGALRIEESARRKAEAALR